MGWEQRIEELKISNFEKRIVRVLSKMLAKPRAVEINYATLNMLMLLCAAGLFVFGLYTFFTQALFAFSLPFTALAKTFGSFLVSFTAIYIAMACKVLVKRKGEGERNDD